MFKPQHTHPFTLAEAVLLDPFTITEEIARLQNSLQHLRETQDQLREHMQGSSTPDPDFSQAIEENEVVIGAQEERILILRRALVQKGVISESSSHYDILSPHPQIQASPPAPANRDAPPTQTEEEEEGIIL